MSIVFLVCALVGGTILVCQFVLLLLGMGGMEGMDGADHGGGLDLGHGGDAGGLADAADVLDGAEPPAHSGPLDPGDPHGSHHLFSVISFRTLTAAVTFFGLAGMAGLSAELPTLWTILLAAGVGLGAMYGVYWLMRSMMKLESDGTVRIERAVGEPGTVYVPIPPGKSGQGKIQLRLAGRLMEYPAVTAEGEKLPTGARVVVVRVAGPGLLEVRPRGEAPATSAA